MRSGEGGADEKALKVKAWITLDGVFGRYHGSVVGESLRRQPTGEGCVR